MSDLISRQAAIDLAKTYEFDDMFHLPVYEEMVSVEDLRKLPSAQPEPCGDCISRQAAIRAYCEHQCGKGMIRGECGCDDCGTIFDEIPSADVVEVVRCKDCKYNDIINQPYDEGFCRKLNYSVDKVRFCSYGERRTDE